MVDHLAVFDTPTLMAPGGEPGIDDLDLSFLQQVVPNHNMTSRDLEVPPEDHALFEQLRNDPKLTSIADEIAFHRYLRIKITRDLMRSGNEEEREELIDDIRDLAAKYGIDSEDLEKFRAAVNKIVPPANISLTHVRALSKLLETSGKLAEQQKKIIDGTEIKVNIAGDTNIQKIFVHVIRPEVPREYWPGILKRAQEFAPLLATSQVLDLDGVFE